MKKLIASCLITACLHWLVGCSSTPVRVNSGPIVAKTFDFIKPKPKPLPVFADPDEKVNAIVQTAITESLARRGITRSETRSEITVAYMVIVGNSASITSIEDYFGYGRDTSELKDRAFKEYTNGDNPEQFRAGTLLIDMLDSNSGKLLHREYATRVLLNNSPDQEKGRRLREVVEEIVSRIHFNP